MWDSGISLKPQEVYFSRRYVLPQIFPEKKIMILLKKKQEFLVIPLLQQQSTNYIYIHAYICDLFMCWGKNLTLSAWGISWIISLESSRRARWCWTCGDVVAQDTHVLARMFAAARKVWWMLSAVCCCCMSLNLLECSWMFFDALGCSWIILDVLERSWMIVNVLDVLGCALECALRSDWIWVWIVLYSFWPDRLGVTLTHSTYFILCLFVAVGTRVATNSPFIRRWSGKFPQTYSQDLLYGGAWW
jgi:hypothetical protein